MPGTLSPGPERRGVDGETGRLAPGHGGAAGHVWGSAMCCGQGETTEIL